MRRVKLDSPHPFLDYSEYACFIRSKGSDDMTTIVIRNQEFSNLYILNPAHLNLLVMEICKHKNPFTIQLTNIGEYVLIFG